VYQWVSGDTPGAVADATKAAVENGYWTVELTAVTQMRRIDTPAVVRDAADRLTVVRDAVGLDIDIIINVRGCIAGGIIKRVVTALEPYDPMYFEGPVLPENARQLPRIEGHTDIPLAMSERMYSRWESQRSAVSDAVDVAQPSPFTRRRYLRGTRDSHASRSRRYPRLVALSVGSDLPGRVYPSGHGAAERHRPSSES